MKDILITDAELAVMKILWKKGEATSAELLAADPRNKSTVKTLLFRLVRKGAVGAEEKEGKAYRYVPLVSSEAYARASGKRFLDTVFDGAADRMLLAFVRDEKVSKTDLERLLALIEKEEKP